MVPTRAADAYVRDLLAWPSLSAAKTHVATEHGFIEVEVAGPEITLTTGGLGDNSAPLPAHPREILTYTRD